MLKSIGRSGSRVRSGSSGSGGSSPRSRLPSYRQWCEYIGRLVEVAALEEIITVLIRNHDAIATVRRV